MAASAQASGLLVDPSPRRPRARGAPAPGRLALTLHCTWGLAQGRRGRGQSLGLTAGCWVRLPSDRGSCSLTDEHQTSSGLALSFRLGSSPSPLDALIEYYVASLNGNVTSLLINQSSSGETGSWDRGVYFRRRQPSRVKEPELRRCEGVQNAHTAVAGGAPGLTAAAGVLELATSLGSSRRQQTEGSLFPGQSGPCCPISQPGTFAETNIFQPDSFL